MRGIFFRRTFQANDFDSFLVNSFQVFGLKTIQTAGVDVSTHHLFNRLFACFIEIFERTKGMGRQLHNQITSPFNDVLNFSESVLTTVVGNGAECSIVFRGVYKIFLNVRQPETCRVIA